MSGANGSVYIVADCNDVNGTCITGKDAAGTGQPENLRYKFNFSGTYYVILDSRSAGTGTWSATGALICLNPPPPNDRCADAILAACGDFSWSGTTTYATNDYSFGTGQSCTGSSADGKDVVYRFNVNAGDSVSVSYRALTTDASMYLVTDCADVVGSCKVGKDETFVGEWETLHYTFPTSGTYYLILDSFEPNSSSSWSANGHLYCNVLGVDPVAPGAGLALRQIQPNPFHERTSILFQLPARARTTLRLYDLQGRVVRTLVDADAEPGLHNAVWDGSDDHGTKV